MVKHEVERAALLRGQVEAGGRQAADGSEIPDGPLQRRRVPRLDQPQMPFPVAESRQNLLAEADGRLYFEDEIVDGNGNIVKVKQQKKQLTRKEKMLRDKQRKMRRDMGEEVSSSDDECN